MMPLLTVFQRAAYINVLQHVSFTCRSVVASPQSSALENLNYTNTEAKLFKLNKVKFNHPQGKNTHTHKRLDVSTHRLVLLCAQSGSRYKSTEQHKQVETTISQKSWITQAEQKFLSNTNAGDILSLHQGEQINPELWARLSLLLIKYPTDPKFNAIHKVVLQLRWGLRFYYISKTSLNSENLLLKNFLS